MATSIVGIISVVLALVRFLIDYGQRQKLIDQGTAAVILKCLQDSDDAIARAQKARNLVRATATRDPDSVLRDDDGYRRTDD